MNPLAIPAFRRLWAAQAASVVGDRLHHVALLWWIMDRTGSVGATGAVLVAATLPTVLLGPVAGTLADRVDRRTLMIGADLARAVFAAMLVALALMPDVSMPAIIALTALLAAGTAFFTPANMAMAPSLVPPEQLLRANAMLESTLQIGGLAGPILGGLVVAAGGPALAFGLNAVTFALSALLLLGLPKAAPSPHDSESFWAAMAHGLGLLRRDPPVAMLLGCFAALNVFTMPILLFLPYFAKSVFEVGAPGLGALEAAVGGGMLAAALYWTARGDTNQRFLVIAGGMVGAALGCLLMGAYVTFPAHLAGLALAGFAIASLNVVVIAFFQQRVPAAEMGRFMGLLATVCTALIPLSYAGYGALAATIDPVILLTWNGVGIGLVALALFLAPGLRRALA